jgi:enoyl-CoA hydratase/carnithine racemase
MTLGITSDVILAADDVDLGYPEIDVGIIPAIHYVHLPRQISRHKAFELLFSGKSISAHEAASLGIINHAVPRAVLMERAFSMAQEFAAKSPTIMARGRRSSCARTILITGGMSKIRSRRSATCSTHATGARDWQQSSKSASRTGSDAF